MECGVALWAGWIHMLMSGRVIPTIGETPTPLSFDSGLKLSFYLWVYHLACRLGIKVYLDLTCHLRPIWFQLAYVMPLCFIILWTVVPCPLQYGFMLFSWAPSRPTICLYNLLEGQPENNWPLGGKCCIISNSSRYSGLFLPCFLEHVQH